MAAQSRSRGRRPSRTAGPDTARDRTEQWWRTTSSRSADRCVAWYRGLPTAWRVVVGSAALVVGAVTAVYAVEFVISMLVGLAMLALLVVFMVAMARSVFGSGGSRSKVHPINGMTDEEWDQMMDPRNDIHSDGMHF